jgi:hypothetical protein
MRGKISDETRAAILKRDTDRSNAVKAGNERRRQESASNFEGNMLAQGFEKFTNEGGQTAFRRPQQQYSSPSSPTSITPPNIDSPTSITPPNIDSPTSITQPKINFSKDNTMDILASYQKMFGGGGQQMQPSGGMNFSGGGGGGGFPSFAQLGQASMGLADAASRRSMAESALQSSLRRGEAGYGSQLRQGEMGTEYGLRGQLSGQESGQRQRELGTEYGLRGQLAGTESGYRQKEMGTEYGLRGQLAGMESGYRQKEMGTEYGLRGQLAGTESDYRQKALGTEYGLRGQLERGQADILAQQSGYSGLSSMKTGIASQRQEDERSQMQQARQIQNSRPYTLDWRGRRAYS